MKNSDKSFFVKWEPSPPNRRRIPTAKKVFISVLPMYNHLILGGTFDHFHKGHELFVKTALKYGTKVTIGLTTEKLYKNKLLSSYIEPYEKRKACILQFIRSHKVKKEITVIPLTNVYGNGFSDNSVDGLVVTQDTETGGRLINKKRKEIGMKPLNIIVVPLVKGDDGTPISSEKIRYGDIDRIGQNYYKWMIDKGPFLLPVTVRTRLREPMGDVIKGHFREQHFVVKEIMNTIKRENPVMIFSIGDIISGSLQEAGFNPSVSVIDFRSHRQALSNVTGYMLHVIQNKRYRNAAGTISLSSVKQVKVLKDRWFEEKKPQLLVIQGEEDLVALPVILMAPLQSFVLYGQYDQGVVLVRVTKEKKKEVWQALQKFDY